MGTLIIMESVAASAPVAERSMTLRKTNDSQFPCTRLRFIVSTFTATCLVGVFVGSELNSNNRGFLMHVTKGYPKLF